MVGIGCTHSIYAFIDYTVFSVSIRADAMSGQQ